MCSFDKDLVKTVLVIILRHYFERVRDSSPH